MRIRALLLFLFGLAAGCSDEGSAGPGPLPDGGAATCRAFDLTEGDGTCVPIGFTPCPKGLVADASGMGCVDEPMTCKDEELPVLGEGCVAVGTSTCATGFVRDETNLGCKPASAPTVCSGATREDFATSCVPVGDCNAAFPPAGATIFVDDNGPVDATHFQSIAAAITAAPSGATIAIEAGVYPAPVTITKPLALVGRCAAQVSIEGSAAVAAGLRVSGVTNVRVTGVRVTGFEPGIHVDAGGALDVEEALIEASRAQGALVSGKSRLGIARSSVRSNLGPGVVAEAGAELVLDATGIADNRALGVSATGTGTKATLGRVRIVATKAIASTPSGSGLDAASGADVTIDESSFESNARDGVDVAGASLLFRSSSVVGGAGIALVASSSAGVTVERSLLAGTGGAQVEVTGGSTIAVADSVLSGGNGGVNARGAKVTIERSGIRGVRGFALGARDAATIDASRVLVRGTRDTSGVAYAVLAASRGNLTARQVAIVDTTGAGAVALNKGSKVTFEGSLVAGITMTSAGLGFGALAEDGGEVVLRGSVVREAKSFGVLVRGGLTTLEDVLVRDVTGDKDGISGMGLLVMDKGASATVTRAGFRGCTLSALLVAEGASLSATNVTVSETQVDVRKLAGRGATAQDARLDMARSILIDNAQAQIGAFGRSTARISESLLGATARVAADEFGHGAFSNGARMDLDRVVVRDQPGVALVYSQGTGRVQRTTVTQNAVGIHVQSSSTLVVGDGEPNELEVVVSDDTVFTDNQSRVGTGELVLPSTVDLPK